MPISNHASTELDRVIQTLYTFQEIMQQPDLWLNTVERVRAAVEQLNLTTRLANVRVLLTGAGTSAYAAASIAAAWPRAVAVPTTDLLVDAERYLADMDVVISLARSGNSPESAAVVKRVRAVRPEILQLAITCNEESTLSQSGLDGLIVLDPKTNDRSLVMTSSFSNLVLAGLALARSDEIASTVGAVSKRVAELLPSINISCERISADVRDRVVILASSPFRGWTCEAGLKLLEMTAGHFSVVTESFLGLRHGPMSFVKPQTLVLCLLSNDPVRRMYEVDLIRELRAKKIGRLVGITQATEENAAEAGDLFDNVLPAVAPHLPDDLRTSFEIVTPQLLGYHLSLSIGLNPDNPSPDGIINRVVQGVRIYPVTSDRG
ncbi:SIS domain-containing protein [Alloacidobacterium dinghuense]|uniref:SIS domain-containing protein n=1 Tax=Alloacidobacterium dinghuense TaxID=2763107 RepID=A0A7G8BMI6_9BACT|nr:SIS domain-containing protein [Alloacidobacterium dinghuense]QNI33756.1 SIS domain-containing protein [Alloacidobacterium dinghuense]